MSAIPASDAQTFLQPLHQLRRRLIVRVLFGELVQLLVIALAAALVAITCDAIFRWRTAPPRWIFSMAVLCAFFGSIGLMIARRNWSISLLGLAERLEQLFPRLAGQLRSAVAIAEAPASDPLAGSPRLRARYLQTTSASLAEVDLSKTISHRRSHVALAMCGGILFFLAIWAIAAPDVVRQAIRRLGAPWRNDPWPRLTVLELAAPQKIARGASPTLTLRSKTAHLPSSATLFVADDSGNVSAISLARSESQFIVTLPRIEKSLWLRAEGGDDDQMPWRRLEVVEPVTLHPSRIEVFPPEYARASAYRVSGEMAVVDGSRLEVEFRSSRPIRDAKLVLPATSGSRSIPLKVDAGGRKITGQLAATLADLSSSQNKLRIDLHDRDGAEVVGAWSGLLKITADSPPVIDWKVSKGPQNIQPKSSVALQARITDDIRLASLELRRRILRDKNDQAAWEPGEPMTLPEEDLKEFSFSQTIDLTSLDLHPTDLVEWLLVATDAKGQIKESEIIRRQVVSPEELRKEADERFERLLRLLQDAARRQSELVYTLRRSENAAAKAATIKSAQFDEHAILEMLAEKSGGALETWRKLVEERQSHSLLSGEDSQFLETAQRDLTTVVQESLPAVLQHLSNPAAELPPAADAAHLAAQQLDEIASRLAHWLRWSRAAESVDELLGAQQELLDQTRQIAPSLLGRRTDELSDEERKQLDALANRQEDLSRQLAELAPPPHLADDAWRSARGAAEEQMRLAAGAVVQNKLSQADSHQSEALQKVRELSSENAATSPTTPSASNPPPGAAPNAARQGPTEAEVKALLQRQTELRDQTEKTVAALAKPGANRPALEAELTKLSQEQAELAKTVESWRPAESSKEPSP